MIQTGLIQNAHNDLVTDASYDFYGLRLATGSLDQRYAVFPLLWIICYWRVWYFRHTATGSRFGNWTSSWGPGEWKTIGRYVLQLIKATMMYTSPHWYVTGTWCSRIETQLGAPGVWYYTRILLFWQNSKSMGTNILCGLRSATTQWDEYVKHVTMDRTRSPCWRERHSSCCWIRSATFRAEIGMNVHSYSELVL